MNLGLNYLIIDNEFSIPTYLSADSDLISEGAYFNNDTSLVSIDFSNNIETENRYFDNISNSKQYIPAKYVSEKNQRKIISYCIDQIAIPLKGKKTDVIRQK